MSAVVAVLALLCSLLAIALVAAALRLTATRGETIRLAAELDGERRLAQEREAIFQRERGAVQEVGERLEGVFAALSRDALAKNSEAFLELAKSRMDASTVAAAGQLDQRTQAIEQMVAPLSESLRQMLEQVRAIERERIKGQVSLEQQVKLLGEYQESLRKETGNLVTALRSPATRGRWGEMQLRRVVEMAGMLKHCDFDEQPSVASADGTVRPDMVVHLAEGKSVVVDAKVPLQAYLEAVDAADDAVRTSRLADHSRQLKEHVTRLAAKAYWQQFDRSPEFVVAFIPGDALLTAAIEHDPGLMDYAVANRVLLATPMTLIALLKAVGYGLRQEAVATSAREVQRLGAELYERLAVYADHVRKVGRGLRQAVDAYNQSVGSFESRVLVSARRFVGLDVVGARDDGRLEPLDQIETLARLPQASELAGPDGVEVAAGREVALPGDPPGTAG